MQQLIACHATMRQQQQRIDNLKEELSQCHKREEAGQDMFLQLYGENQKICAERRRLDAKENHLERMFKVVRIGNKELEEAKTCLEHDRMLFEANAPPQSKKSDVKDENPVKEKREVGEINPFAAGMTSKQFRDKDISLWNLNDAERAKVVALRYKHEYHRGWLDAMKSHDDKEAFWMIKDGVKRELESRPLGILKYMYNRANPKHPFTAGLHTGLLFGWSALCNIHSLPQHDVRLDKRKWDLEDLLNQAEPRKADEEFWEGLYEATEKVRQLFELKVKSGVWNHRADPAQMELLRPITKSYGFDKQQEQVRAARNKKNDGVWQWAEREKMKRAGVEVGELHIGCFRDPEEPKNDEQIENNEKLGDEGEL
jgi:hypothetical protein